MCQGEGLLAIGSFTLSYGIPAESIGISLVLLGLATLEAGRNGETGLVKAGSVLSVLSALFLFPVIVLGSGGFVVCVLFGSCVISSQLILGFLTLGVALAAVVGGYAGGSYRFRGIHARRVVLGLVLELLAALLVALWIPGVLVDIVLPVVVMSVFSLLSLVWERYSNTVAALSSLF